MKVNGKTIALERERTLSAFLTDERYDSRTIAVERNGAIVPRADYENILLAEEDTLEIVRFVGGG